MKKRQLSEWELLLASTYITDAQASRPTRLERNPTPEQVRSYRMYHSLWLRLILYAFVTLNLLLALFEKPAVPNASVPYWGTMIMEIICLAFYVFRLLHYKRFCPAQYFWDKKTILVTVCMGLTLIDMIIFVILVNSGVDAVRATRLLRPVFLVNFSDSRQIRKAFRNIRRTIPGIVNVLVLLFLSIALFALMALKLFSGNGKDQNGAFITRKGRSYFDSFFEIYWRLYVLITTANSPDVMMPAYNFSRWYALFFILFLLICMYIFVSIVLAVVYQNYRKHLKNEVRKTARTRRQSLMEAWRIVKVTKDTGKGSILPLEHFRQIIMFHEQKRSLAQILLLFQVLDEKSSGFIDKEEFMQLPELLNVGVVEEKDSQLMIAKHLPRLWHSFPSVVIRAVVKHKAFRYFFDFVIVANAIIIATELDESESSGDPIETAFLVLFNIEIWLKLYTLGFWEFVRIKWNVFDFFIIEVATLFAIATKEDLAGTIAIDILMVLRVLRLVKIIGDIERFRAIIGTIWQIGPSFSMYGGILFVIYYVFAIIGMEAFQGKIMYIAPPGNTTQQLSLIIGNYTDEQAWLVCNNSDLNNTEFADLRYCANNFNDLAAAFVTLFEMMVVNQWHVITQGFVAVTSRAARLYFITFHVCCVMVVLNIFVAFILEAFLMQKSKTKYESKIALKIKELGVGIGMKPAPVQLSGKLQEASHGMKIRHQDDVPAEMVIVNAESVGGGTMTKGNTLASTPTSTTQLHPNDTPPAVTAIEMTARTDGGDKEEITTVTDLAVAAGMHFRLKEKISNIDMLLYRMFEEEIRSETTDDADIYRMLDSDEEDSENEEEEEALALSYYHSQITSTYRRSQIGLDSVSGAANGDPVVHTDYQI
eukprot:scpid48024/ scgid22700/ Two pore calcium channel protein 1; Voltage-dependent calcium channel protein TPC1